MMRLPEFRLTPEAMTAEAAALSGFAHAAADVGHRHRLGGEPTWLQGDETPRCPECGQRMTFYAQLDSVGDEIALADVGMIFVFVCFDDFATRSVLQSG